MASIIKAGQDFQNFRIRNCLTENAKNKVYDPPTNFFLGKLAKSQTLLGKPISSMKDRRYQPVTGTGSLRKSAVNMAKNYDACLAKNGEAVSRYAASILYTGVKSILGLLTFGILDNTKIGRILLEGISQTLGFTVRAVGLLATGILRALPYLAIVAGIGFAGWQLGVLAGAAIGVKAILTVGLPVLAGLAYIIFNQVQIHLLGKKVDKIASNKDQQNKLMKKLVNKDLATQKPRVGFLSRNKGKIAAAIFAAGAGALAYKYGGDAVDYIKSTDAGVYVKPYLEKGVEAVKDTASSALQKASGLFKSAKEAFCGLVNCGKTETVEKLSNG